MGLRRTLFIGISIFFSFNSLAVERVVYGDDDRKDYYEVADPAWQEAMDATVALISRHKITEVLPDQFIIETKHYGDSYNLCPNQPFFNQERAASCSGSLIAPDIIMTAGHCVRGKYDCRDTSFVFDFNYKQKGILPDSYSKDQIYSCAEIIKSKYNALGTDFSLIRLDRKVVGRTPASLRVSGKVDFNSELVVIGHPSGLPAKYADGGFVRQNSKESHFIANLDTFGGNSGSPVFNKDTGLIEGILVRGAKDYNSPKNSCKTINHCKSDGCRGEDVVRVSEVLPFLSAS